jgi:trehalose/maltose transport system substrate-binding protein
MILRTLSILFILSLVAGIACSPAPESTDEVTLVFAGGTTGKQLDLTVAALRRFMDQNPGIRVHVRPTPREYGERHALYQQILGTESPSVDVFQIDVVWTQEMAPHAFDLMPYFDQSTRDKHFSNIIENNTIEGRFVGAPWFSDAPVLFYRTDLLEKYGFDHPPATWDELETMAQKIQDGEREAGNLGFWGYVWQANPYEGLTCNALEWQYSQGGGNFIDEQGNPSVNNPEAAKAFARAASWIGSISPKDVAYWDEDESQIPWQKGDAAFMRNWPTSYAISKETAIADKFDVTKMPAGPGGTAAVLGGWQLMVSKYSKHPQAAARLVTFLVSESEQKQRAIVGSYNPTIRALYRDADVLKAVPFFEGFDETLEQAVLRPSRMTGESYNQVSEVYWNSVRKILTGGDPKTVLAAGEQQIADALGR